MIAKKLGLGNQDSHTEVDKHKFYAKDTDDMRRLYRILTLPTKIFSQDQSEMLIKDLIKS